MRIIGDIQTIARRLLEGVLSKASGSENRGWPASDLRDRIREERETIAKKSQEIGYLETISN